MAIMKMKKLQLWFLRSQREELLRELMLIGCLEVSEPPMQDDDSTVILQKGETETLSIYKSQFSTINGGLSTIAKYLPEKTSFLAPMPEIELAKLLDESKIEEMLALASKILEMDETIRRLTADESKKKAEIESLEPWKTLDMSLDFSETNTSRVVLGCLPASANLEEAKAILAEKADMAELFSISSDKSLNYLVLVCHKEVFEICQDTLRPLGFSVMTLGDFRDTAANSIDALERDLKVIASEKEDLTAKIIKSAEQRMQLRLCADRFMTKISRAEADTKLRHTETVSCLVGWVPCEYLPKLENLLEQYDCAWETFDPVEDEYPVVPIKLKNNVVTRSQSVVTEMYSLPAYDGVDPNPLMAPFFILFYGMMMADMGYGLVMMLATAFIMIKKKPRVGLRNFCELIFLCGVSTFIWGMMTGGFFGDAPLQVAKILNPDTTWEGLPYLFSPMEDTVMILLGSMALGFIHIVTGMAISFVEKLKRKQYLDAIFEELTWWIVFAGIAALALGAGTIVLLIGGILVVAGPIITGEGFGKVTGIFGSLYNHVTGYFGDILSYARLMALMLAGNVIAVVFNTIGAIPGNLVVFLLISLVGNALNFALNILGCFVHDLRLQCLEYFGKFYKDGGKAFRPLEVETNFVNVVAEKSTI